MHEKMETLKNKIAQAKIKKLLKKSTKVKVEFKKKSMHNVHYYISRQYQLFLIIFKEGNEQICRNQ